MVALRFELPLRPTVKVRRGRIASLPPKAGKCPEGGRGVPVADGLGLGLGS